jgi:broad-specificity NMP kinase
MQTTLILQDCGYAYANAEDMYFHIQDVIKRHKEKDSGEGDWLESLRNFIESEVE